MDFTRTLRILVLVARQNQVKRIKGAANKGIKRDNPQMLHKIP